MNYIRFRKQIFWLLTLLFWLIIGGIDMYINYQRGFNAPGNFVGEIITITTGLLLSLLLGFAYKRFCIFESQMPTIIVAISVLSIAAGISWHFIDYSLSIPIYGMDPILNGFKRLTISGMLKIFLRDTLIFLSWSAIYVGTTLYNDRILQIELKQGMASAAEFAQLKLLRYQLNPHFLFNSLSSLRSLIRKDQEQAEEMLSHISEFLRYSLNTRDEIMVPLSEEIAMINLYLQIEKVRFTDNLDYKIEVSPEAQKYQVFSFMLQPLIENSVKHGMQSSKMPLKVEITADVSGNELFVEMKNSGYWKKEILGVDSGIGLANLKSRLEQIYPGSHDISITKESDSVSVTLKLYKDN